MAAVKTEAAGSPQLRLSETNINWDRLDKTRFHVIGAVLFTAQASLVHPMMLIKTRMQVAEAHYKHVSGISLFRNVLKTDGIRGLYRGFGTGATGAIPGRVLSLTSLEVSKDLVLKSTKSLDMPEASRIALANGVGGMMSTIISCVYFVPLEVVCQRLMVQGLPGSTVYNGPYDVIGKVYKAEGFRGFYRGFGMSIVTQSPASALWWSA